MFEPVVQADNTAEFSKVVYWNANVISTHPFADPIALRITASQPVLDMPQYVRFTPPPSSPLPTPSTNSTLCDAYRLEFADNYDQGPAEIHSHGQIVTPSPSFDEFIGSIPIRPSPSMSTRILKN